MGHDFLKYVYIYIVFNSNGFWALVDGLTILDYQLRGVQSLHNSSFFVM